mgnify:FL=1
MKKFIALLLTLLLALSAAAPALAEKQTYRSLYSGEVTTLNYLTTTTTSEFGLLSNLIDTLVESDRYGQLQPCLAESWEASADGLTWTFHLRQGVQWVDAQGNAVAEVTAHDFVTAAEYILNAQHASGSAKTLYKIIVGAKEYYDGTATPKEGEQPAPKNEWDTVGVKALNDYTLQYTLKNPVAYFLSMVDNQAFMPVYDPFLTEKGEQFGLATGNDTLLYCGAYTLTEFKPQETRVLTKNSAYWDLEHVTIDQIVYRYNKEASTISADLYLKGEVDSASISAEIASQWLDDPVKSEYIRPDRPTSCYSYFFSFNYDPQFAAEYEPENWAKAVVNENFRKSFYYGLDRLKVKTAADADNAEALLFNSITPTDFLIINGEDYVKTGALKAITELGVGTYQTDKAIEYRDKAIEELTAAGVTFPIKVFMPYNASVNGWADECQIIEQQLEELLGKDYIDIIIEAYPSSGFLGSTRRSGNYAFMKCNWGPDYDDPETFSEPFAAGNNYNFIDKCEGMDEVRTELYSLFDQATAIYDDLTARYAAFAQAEAFIVDHAIVIPYGFSTGGYTASRIDPFTLPYTATGISKERFKGAVLLDQPMSTDQYYDAYDQWLSDLEALTANP